jgi:hypothetical protein
MAEFKPWEHVVGETSASSRTPAADSWGSSLGVATMPDGRDRWMLSSVRRTTTERTLRAILETAL